MARFYKTATPTFIEDMIYQPPWELMKDVIQTHDKRIEKGDTDLDAFSTTIAGLENLKTDDPAVQEKINSLRAQADEVSKNMHGDIANYSKYLPNISNIKRDLTTEMDTGVLGRAGKNYAEEVANTKMLQDLKGADPTTVQGIIQMQKTKYEEQGGLNYKSPTEYNKYIENILMPADAVDETSLIASVKSQMNADQTAWSSSKPTVDGYIKSGAGTNQYIKKERVQDYFKNTPAMDKWRNGMAQKLELEGFNQLGKRGQELKDYVALGLAAKEEGLINAATGAISYSSKTSQSGIQVDGKQAADEAKEKGVDTTGFEVAVDRRTTGEKTAVSNALNDIKVKLAGVEGFDTSSDESILVQLNAHKKAGTLGKFVTENGLKMNALGYNAILGISEKSGIRTNILDIPQGGFQDATQKSNYVKEVKIVVDKVSNLSAAEQRNVTISSNFGIGSSLGRDTVLGILNAGMIKPEQLGGKTGTAEGTSIAPPGKTEVTVQVPGRLYGTNPEKQTIPVWYSSGGDTVQYANGSYPANQSEAIQAAQETGKTLKTTKQTVYTNVMGNEVAIVDSTVHRYKSATGNTDEYEIEATAEVIKNGVKVYETIIIKIPTSTIKVDATTNQIR